MNNLTGKNFDRLTVIKYVGNSRWLCKCICGKEKSIVSTDLIKGKTRSCGCLQRERTSKANSKHKLHDTRVYNIWCGMKQRCYYKNHIRYARYGARGIKVCDEWKNSFQAFYDWSIKNGYQDNLTLDRINNDGNYEPSNCRWATYKEQYLNSSSYLKRD